MRTHAHKIEVVFEESPRVEIQAVNALPPQHIAKSPAPSFWRRLIG